MSYAATLEDPKVNIAKLCAIVAVTNAAFSIFSGFFTFAVVGHIAYETNQEIQDVTDEAGQGTLIHCHYCIPLILDRIFVCVFLFLTALCSPTLPDSPGLVFAVAPGKWINCMNALSSRFYVGTN